MVGLGSISLKDPVIVKGLWPDWRDVTRAVQRLAALVLRPRLHLIRFHGVLAPNAKLRREIIPSPPEPAIEPSTDPAHAQSAPARMSLARLLKRVFGIDIEHCPNCGGALKIMAAIEDPPVIVIILAHLGPRTRAVGERIKSFRPLHRPNQSQAKPQFSPNTPALDDPPVRQYGSRQRKGCLNFYFSNKVQFSICPISSDHHIVSLLTHPK